MTTRRGDTTVELAALSSPLSESDRGGRPGGGGTRGLLGVQAEPDGKAAKITGITPGGAAEKADLRVGDRVSKLDGMDVDGRPLRDLLTGKKAGDAVKVLFRRDDKEVEKTITLGGDPAASGPGGPSWDTRRGAFRKPKYNLAVLIVGFPDQAVNDKISVKDWADALFSADTYTTKSATGGTVYGSMRDYYKEQSCGR